MNIVFDGLSVIYLLSVFLMGVIILGFLIQRQLTRNRLNSARSDPIVDFSDLPNKQRTRIKRKIELVKMIRAANVPRLTDCTTINEHSNAPYLHRMIAVDEVVHEIDAQMERISPAYAREPGESTLVYLLRLRQSFSRIPLPLIHRIAFLYESARHRMQKFDLEERMELKSLLSTFVKIVADSTQVTMGHAPRDSIKGRGRRDKFGGSDGVRLLLGSTTAPHAATQAATHPDERVRLLPSTGISTFHRRRRSDTNFNAAS